MRDALKKNLGSLSYREKLYFLQKYYRTNLFDFVREVLGFSLIPESHRRWERYLTDNIDFANFRKGTGGQKLILLEMPRETYKSTFFTVGGILYALLNDPNLATLITSASASNSKAWLYIIQKKIDSELFIDLYGQLKTQTEWRDSDITFCTRTIPRAEPSILCAGKDSTITSKHFDLIFCDDLVTQVDRDSAAEREKSIRYIDDLVDLANKQYGVIVFVGTTWHFSDANQYIEKELNSKLKEQGHPEVIVHKEPVYKETAKGRIYFFPELYPEKRCAEVRSKKSDIANFSANYLLKPIHPESQIFKQEFFGYFNYAQDLKRVSHLFVHLDPAGAGEDFTAIVVVGRRDDGRRLVLDAWVDHLRPSAREEAMYALWEQYSSLKYFDPKDQSGGTDGTLKPLEHRWQVETVANQEEIHRSLIEYFLSKNIADFPLGQLTRVANKWAKITNLELPITNGSLLFRDDWQTAPHGYRRLIDQLLNFPLDHDDGPDALKEAFDLSEEPDVFAAVI